MKIIYEDKVPIGEAEFTQFPGNSTILISHSVMIDFKHRGFGHGTKFMRQRINEARKQAATYLLCTVNCDNNPQIKLMTKFGWKPFVTIINESSSTAILFGRDVWDDTGL